MIESDILIRYEKWSNIIIAKLAKHDNDDDDDDSTTLQLYACVVDDANLTIHL